MRTIGLVGWSGSGKTHLVVRLIPEIAARGYTVSTMKHTHHSFDMDQPGKDSHNHRMAGASEVLITSSSRWALVHELRGRPEPDIETLVANMTPVDLLLIEGFKYHPHDKVEVFRPSLGKPLLAEDDDAVVAVASNEAVPGLRVPLLDLDDTGGVADFILDHVGLDRGGLDRDRPGRESRSGAA